MSGADLTAWLLELAADHGAIRMRPHETSAALLAAADEIDRKEGELLGADALHEAEKRMHNNTKSECNVLAGILRDCDAVLETIEPESTDEAESLAGLRTAIAYALDPYKREGTLL